MDGVPVPMALWSVGNLTHDSLTAIMKPETLQPYYMFPMSAGVKYIGTVLIFGFMLKTKKPAPASLAKASVGLVAKLGFMGLAINAYRKDIIRIQTLGIAYAPIVVCLSPNLVAAIVLWNKIAKQSPVPTCRLEATYSTLSCLGPMAFPRGLGSAFWMGPVEQIYALLLLPYMVIRSFLWAVAYLLGFPTMVAIILAPELLMGCHLYSALFWAIAYLPLRLCGHGDAAGSHLATDFAGVRKSGGVFLESFAAYLYFCATVLVISELTFIFLICVYSVLAIGKGSCAITIRVLAKDDKLLFRRCVRRLEAKYGTPQEPLLDHDTGGDGDLTEESRVGAERPSGPQNAVKKARELAETIRDRLRNPWKFFFEEPIVCTEGEVRALRRFNDPGERGETDEDTSAIVHELDAFKLRLILSDMRTSIRVLISMQLLVTLATRVFTDQEIEWTFSWATLNRLLAKVLLTISERHWDTYVQSLRTELDLAASKGSVFAYTFWTLV